MTQNLQGEMAGSAWPHQRRWYSRLTQDQFAQQVGCSPAALRQPQSEVRRSSSQLVERLDQTLRVAPGERPKILPFVHGDTFALLVVSLLPSLAVPLADMPAFAEPRIRAFTDADNHRQDLQALDRHAAAILIDSSSDVPS